MAGTFEVFVDAESLFRFRLTSPDGTVIAVSSPFQDKPAVVAGIAAARECAGTGLVTDLCPVAARTADDGFHARAKALRRPRPSVRWTGAA